MIWKPGRIEGEWVMGHRDGELAAVTVVADLACDPEEVLQPGARVIFAAAERMHGSLRADTRYYVELELEDGSQVRLCFCGCAVARLAPAPADMVRLLRLPDRPGFWTTEEFEARVRGNVLSPGLAREEE